MQLKRCGKLVEAAEEAAAVRHWELTRPREPVRVLVGVNFNLAADNDPLEPIPILRRGGNVTLPVKVKDAQPIYPLEARKAGVHGAVVLDLTIGRDGHVRDAYILQSVPALDAAALDAALQWVIDAAAQTGRSSCGGPDRDDKIPG